MNQLVIVGEKFYMEMNKITKIISYLAYSSIGQILPSSSSFGGKFVKWGG